MICDDQYNRGNTDPPRRENHRPTGPESLRVKRKQGIQVWAKPLQRPHCYYCDHEQLTIKATYERTVKHTRQGDQVITLHLRMPKYYCSHCHRYFRHRFVGIRPRYRASEAYRLDVFEAHDGGCQSTEIIAYTPD